jgi:repressor LexA
MSLTRRQREILDFIASFLERNGYAPSILEIGAKFGLSSSATVHKHLAALEARGRIRRHRGRRRFVELIPEEGASAGAMLPLMGTVAAGRPIEAIETREMLSVPAFMARRENSYVLRVSGDSMIDDQIRDGDYIVMESRKEASDGETVVALLEGGEATLKRFYREKGNVRLQPANPAFPPIVVPGRSVRILGVVTGLIRRL